MALGVLPTISRITPLLEHWIADPVLSTTFVSVAPSAFLSKISRVPEAWSRITTTIGLSGPPTAFQFFTLPVKMALTWASERLVIGMLGLTTIAITSKAMSWLIR